MIVYFSGSTRNFKEDFPIYRRIVDTVRALGHTINNDWVETERLRHLPEVANRQVVPWDIKNIVQEVALSIENAELVIAEASNGSAFGVGYEVAMALQRRKPTLILVRKEAVLNSYATGLDNDLITYKKYSNDNLEQHIESFIKENTITTKDLRFNFVIDRKIYNHLRSKSFRFHKTKAEILRDLLLEDIEKER